MSISVGSQKADAPDSRPVGWAEVSDEAGVGHVVQGTDAPSSDLSTLAKFGLGGHPSPVSDLE